MHEPGLPEMVRRNAERLTFTTEMREVLENAQLLFCCVDTPPTYSGDADLSRVQAVLDELGDSNEHAIVMKSTVPVGTGRSIQRDRESLGYVSNPEFLKEGTAVADFLAPNRVVVGANDGSAGFADRVAALYEPLDAPIVRTDVASSEMIKLASNAFLATKISFINEIANVSEELGADVSEVARGMGLDERIGSKFLQAGIGYGGSCLTGDETVLARHRGRTVLLSFEQLWSRLGGAVSSTDAVVEPSALEVLSWIPGADEPQFMPVMAATRRQFEGEIVEVRTKMGRRLRCTPDHPWVTGDGLSVDVEVKAASDLTAADWVPLMQGRSEPGEAGGLAPVIGAAEVAELAPHEIIVRPPSEQVAAIAGQPLDSRREIFATSASAAARTGDVKRTGTVRLDELSRAELPLRAAHVGTNRNRQYVTSEISLDPAFWRVVGLYIAEGHTNVERRAGRTRRRVCWSFHPTREQHLVDEVGGFFARHGVSARVYEAATVKQVSVSSRLLEAWWTGVLGLGADSYEQRIPDLLWDRCDEDKRALLSGLWEGDGSWSLVRGAPSVVLELGTVSRELADGVLRLLGDLRIMASQRVGRTAKSTRDTCWIRISGADQIARASWLVPERDRREVESSIARQAKRIAPTGYRRRGAGPAWARVVSALRRPYSGPVYSLEVPGAHTFVTTGGLTVHNCFPKDVSALKQLAGNSGYAFQLLTAVIEVNELQKRRTVSKLQKHLGSLVNKEVALLGVAFKPDTDDVREAASLVLAARLQGEGANVRVYDPVASDNASEMLGGAVICGSALEALDGADAAVLVTEWDEFAELDWAGEVKERMATPLVVDGRNFLDREALRAAGFTYEGIGR